METAHSGLCLDRQQQTTNVPSKSDDQLIFDLSSALYGVKRHFRMLMINSPRMNLKFGVTYHLTTLDFPPPSWSVEQGQASLRIAN